MVSDPSMGMGFYLGGDEGILELAEVVAAHKTSNVLNATVLYPFKRFYVMSISPQLNK